MNVPAHGSEITLGVWRPAVLVTRFLTEEGVGEVVDFMPVAGDKQAAEHQIVRLVRCSEAG